MAISSRVKSPFLLVFFTCLIFGVGGCSGDREQLPKADMQQFLDKTVAGSTAVPGAIVAVARGGEKWIGVAGMADTAANVPAKAGQRARIGSLTKQFTAALILKLAEEGRLSLDDTVRKWLPNIQLKNDEFITVRMLLNHTSGIPEFTTNDFWNNISFPQPYREWQPGEVVDLVRNSTFVAPATVYSYCNTGYIVAGMIAEAAAGEPARQAMKRRFFTPLGMNDTELAPTGTMTGDYFHGYWQRADSSGMEDVSTWNPSGAWTAGAIVTTAQDLLKWADGLFNGRVISFASLETMLTPVAPSTNYGLGLGLQKAEDGRTFIFHGGSIPGYEAALLHHRPGNLTIIVLTNREDITKQSNDILNPLLQGMLKLLPYSKSCNCK
jgi:D-alanyl-D-alanine carboxypeptidase